MSRRITDMRIISAASGDSFQYGQSARQLVDDGFQPYGQPYTNGSRVFREFVKYEYIDDYDEDLYDEEDTTDRDGRPWENVDFFEDI